jgi:hypothetical protein
VTAGEEREALDALADRFCAELGYPQAGELGDEAALARIKGRDPMFAELIGPDEEKLVAAARRALVRIAAALETKHSRVVSDTAYRALFDGAEFVMRSELAAGNLISPLMPSFVFLISLPMVSQEEALDLSRRSTALLDETAG